MESDIEYSDSLGNEQQWQAIVLASMVSEFDPYPYDMATELAAACNIGIADS